MYLCCLEIENFRGLRFARIDFGENTVLTGENDSGKTSLLEAVSLVLSPIPENRPITCDRHDFYMTGGEGDYRPAGPIKIKLTFRERQTDEWSLIRSNDFGLSLTDDKEVLQELTLDVRVDPAADGGKSEAQWRITTGGSSRVEFTRDMAVLSWIRRLNPVFRIKSGVYLNLSEEAGNGSLDEFHPADQSDFDRGLVEKIMQSYQNLISGDTPDGNVELQAGYRAALHYLGKVSNLFIRDGQQVEQIIYEILGKKVRQGDKAHKEITFRHGSAAEKIGMLLFTTAFLQSGGLKADPSAEPIIIIEDPEAHLHPMTLESVKLLIGRLTWQKIITTQSGNLLSDFPLEDIRRITRHEGHVRQHWAKPGSLSREEVRRLSYHVRKRISTAMFARCWLLVEGESEVWLLPHLAKLCGYNLTMEGIVCVEFAQCGIPPLVKAARQLGINWFLLADGDAAGKAYIETAKHFAQHAGEAPEEHCMRLREPDIEHHFFFNGYAGIYAEYAGIPDHMSHNIKPRRIISMAIHRNSKPFMAIALIEAIARPGSPGVPRELRHVVESCVKLAK